MMRFLLSALLTLGIMLLVLSIVQSNHLSAGSSDAQWRRRLKTLLDPLLNPIVDAIGVCRLRIYPRGPDDLEISARLKRVDKLRNALYDALRNTAHPLNHEHRQAVHQLGRETANQLMDAAWRLARLRRLQAVMATDSAEYFELAEIANQFWAELDRAAQGLETLSVSAIRLNFTDSDDQWFETIGALREANRRVSDLIVARNLVK